MKASALDSLKSVKPNVLLAVLAVLAAAWFAWQANQASSIEALVAEAASVRADVASKIGEQHQAAVARLDATRARIALATALKRGETQAASDLVAKDWAGVEAVEWHEPGLDAAYADPPAFGYGKLGILELAVQRNATQAGVIKDAGGPRFGLAAPVLDDGRVLSMVYVRLPLETLTAPLQSAALDRLKQFEFNLRREAEGGNQPLSLSASDEVPAGFRDAIAEYYRSLARQGTPNSTTR